MYKPVFSVAQMRAVDAGAIANDTMVGYFYMQRAAGGILRTTRTMISHPEKDEIAVFCGKGNNGGDGFVVARLLLNEGYKVMCFSLASPEELKGECAIACREFISCKGPLLVVDDVADLPHLSRYVLIIDALLGIGGVGDPHGLYGLVINLINASAVRVLAVDTPSGLNNDTGVPGSPCVKATVTVTMGYPKIGHYFYPGKELVGTCIVEDLGYQEEVVCSIKPAIVLPSIADIREMVPPRKPAGSKKEHGRVLIVGGSPGMTGSVTMAAHAAFRSGCGMVFCGVPQSLLSILSIKCTEPVLYGLPESDEGTVSEKALASVLELTTTMQAVCIGPGISHYASTVTLVRKFVERCTTPIVLDADGLNSFKDTTDLLKNHAGEIILTPHIQECERLFGAVPDDPLARVDYLRMWAKRYGIAILLKGNPTLFADTAGIVHLLPFGNSALAKSGSGDVLSGIITALIAQGASISSAAIAGAYLHGTAGVLASQRLTEYCVIASDIIDNIAPAMATILI